MTYKQASILIGRHFPEINDKLTNYIELSTSNFDNSHSELVLASIAQKENSLRPIPFSNAINFKSNQKYLPLFIFISILISALLFFDYYNVYSQSFNRVIHFNQTFAKPAAFQFVLKNGSLEVEPNKEFVIDLTTVGKVVPDEVYIHFDNEKYLMEKLRPGKFSFKIDRVLKSMSFEFSANEIRSSKYEVRLVKIPVVRNIQMVLQYPKYLNQKPVIIEGTGNAIVPEGSVIKWLVKASSTTKIIWNNFNNSYIFNRSKNDFFHSSRVKSSFDYTISTTNEVRKNYEILEYSMVVVKDQFPTIIVEEVTSKLGTDSSYYVGKVSDDHGISQVQLVYYKRDNPQNIFSENINVGTGPEQQFALSFPGSLLLEAGVTYDFYFLVFDNDGVNGSKSSRSSLFSNKILSSSEIIQNNFKEQKGTLHNLSTGLKKMDKQFAEIDQLQKNNKQKENLKFTDQQKVDLFLEQQSKQNEELKTLSEKLLKTLQFDKIVGKDADPSELKNRVEKATKELDNNQRLLEELQRLKEKISNEQLFDKIEQLKQTSKNSTKNLEQLVELTKRFYVSKKADQIADNLLKLSSEQQEIAEKKGASELENQKRVNEIFKTIEEELNSLKQDNNLLKNPLNYLKDKNSTKDISDDLQKAIEELKGGSKATANKKQSSAASKMKELANELRRDISVGKQDQLKEDTASLRQILDNLLSFSMQQEEVMKRFKGRNLSSTMYTSNIKAQQNLRQQFRFIDDSLFALSLRNPKIGENITTEIGIVQYNTDKAIEALGDALVPKATSHQQYAISGANKLGDFLSNILKDMQTDLSSMSEGKPQPGKGNGIQLPDIIQKQKKLGEKVGKGMKAPGKGEEKEESGEGSGGGREAGKKGIEGESKGDSGGGKSGNKGLNSGEQNAEAIMEIYKEQVKLRDQLQDRLEKARLLNHSKLLLDQMKSVEKQILNKGFNNDVYQRMLNIQHEMLKLENATQQQGESSKRESEQGFKKFINNSNEIPKSVLDYLNSIEILNRQSLPLRSNFNQKVREYFNTK